MKYIFGIDIGGTTIKMGLFDKEGNLLDKWEIPTNTKQKGIHILPEVAESLQKKLEEKNIHKEDILGAGLGVPGPVTADGVVNHCINLGWEKFSVAKELEAMIGFSVKAANDANAAALGEIWQGSGKGYESVLLVTIGTGIGGGLVLNGKIHAGVTGSGGEIGHICVNPTETLPCSCGNYGCMEQYTSATGVLRMAKQRLTETNTPSVLRQKEALTTKDVLDGAKTGDALSLGVVDTMADIMGRSLAICCSVADMELIILGGGVSKAGKFLLDKVQEYYKKYAFHTQKDTEFRLAVLGNDAGIYGAARLMI